MPTDNGPDRDVSPAKTPDYKKPDPHESDDPTNSASPDGPYEGGFNPKQPYDFDEKTSKT